MNSARRCSVAAMKLARLLCAVLVVAATGFGSAAQAAPFRIFMIHSTAADHIATARRRATARVLGGWVESGDWALADAVGVAELIGAQNARRVYRLP